MRLLLEVEQVHLLAQLAMVALGRFLQPVEVRVELLSVEPAGAVDARQPRVLLVAPPIRPRPPPQPASLPIELELRSEPRRESACLPVHTTAVAVSLNKT